MSSRRVPLSNVPNATNNSPYRAVAAAAAASKRARPHANVQREVPYGQPPPLKKQMLDLGQARPRTPPREQPVESAEGRVFTKKTTTAQMTAFDRKLLAVKDKQQHHHQQRLTRTDKTSQENLETIRQWQKHYRKVFPHFVFYFESIPEDVRVRCSKQVTSLGAREEKFFSKNVTHVVTTRPIPLEPTIPTSTDTIVPSSTTNGPPSQQGQIQTINPSLLDRSSEALQALANNIPPKGKFTFEPSLNRKVQGSSRHETGDPIHHGDLRKPQSATGDVLLRAREMGMKIWALEKVQRMMMTMFETDTGSQAQHGHNTRSNVANPKQGLTRSAREPDLSQLLRNERVNGPTDRDPTVATKEMVQFKGPFIYVRDMDEKARPIMVREYPKVANREAGEWPQFRSVRDGKCPFLEDVGYNMKASEKEKLRLKGDQLNQEKENQGAPRTRAAKAALEATKMQPPPNASRRKCLTELENGAEPGGLGLTAPKSKLFEPPMQIPAKRSHPEEVTRPLQNQHVGRGGPAFRFFGGEPVASGVQQSNITSAIRSQMISSTAAAPGAKAGTSKEVFELKRKVLEKRSGPSGNGISSSHRMIDSAGSAKSQLNHAANFRAATRGKDKLRQIEEDFSASEGEESKRQIETMRKLESVPKKVKKDLKPGYCENCRDKFDDFDEHVISRKHRKFAVTDAHWDELDSLLAQLVRPLREEYTPDL
ncbi:MAG: hypothetical protein M1837_003699 [Sclerophora amabilis]|nr:MAG: hypothetical protein M1837_003699 [Sclerophora amabilis]